MDGAMNIDSYVSKRVFGGVRVMDPERAKQVRAATLGAMNTNTIAASLPGGSAGIETRSAPITPEPVSPGHFNSTNGGLRP